MTTRGPRGAAAATRGESTVDPRPPASSANAARACLEHLCACLRALGVGTGAGATPDPTALTAETLRRAKFDQPAAAPPLWRALHDLFLVSHAGFPEPSVAAETLRALRDEAKDGETDERADEARVAKADASFVAHRAVALRGLRLARYPRVHELVIDEPDALGLGDGDPTTARDPEARLGSRAALVALAWTAEKMDVFARARADENARATRAALVDFDPSKRRASSFDETDVRGETLLPPFGSDAAASPSSAARHAATAEAAESAYLRELDARAFSARPRRRGDASPASVDPLARERQAACLAQRVWQSVAHVHALERARAARRIAVFGAQAKRARRGADDATRALTATEIRLARDPGARARATAAMRAVLTARDEAKATIALAETFWAWMRSVLELDEKERGAKRSARAKDASSDAEDAPKTRGSPFHARLPATDRSDVSALTRALEQAARRVGPVLRHRRRDVETVARTWRRTREATRLGAERSAELEALAAAAAARLPSMASFEAGARAKQSEKSAREGTVRDTPSRDAPSFGSRRDSASVGEDSDAFRRFFEKRFSFAAARRAPADAADVSFEDAASVPDVGARDADHAVTETTRDEENEKTTPFRDGARARFGSSLLPGEKKKKAPRGETCEEAAARLRGSLKDAEALLETQRARAAAALRREVCRAFGNDDATRAPAAVHGWDR